LPVMVFHCLPFQSTSVHPWFYCGVRVPQALVFCVVFCRSMCLFVFFLLVIVLSVLGFKNPFGIVRPIYACPKLKQNNYACLCKSYNSIAGVDQGRPGERSPLIGIIISIYGESLIRALFFSQNIHPILF
jgi:hypothetical protein